MEVLGHRPDVRSGGIALVVPTANWQRGHLAQHLLAVHRRKIFFQISIRAVDPGNPIAACSAGQLNGIGRRRHADADFAVGGDAQSLLAGSGKAEDVRCRIEKAGNWAAGEGDRRISRRAGGMKDRAD